MLITELDVEIKSETAPGLSDDESHMIEQEAFRLLIQDRAICVGRQLDDDFGVNIKIFGETNRWHTIGRRHGAYYILDPDQNVLVECESFIRLLKMVQTI